MEGGGVLDLEAGWVLAVRLELGAQVAGLELLGEALVVRPEQADVGDGKLDHGEAFQPQAEGPRLATLPPVLLQDLLLHHPAGEEQSEQWQCRRGREGGGG